MGLDGVCVCVYIIDGFDAASWTGPVGMVSKCLKRCYLYKDLGGCQEQQEMEEEEEEEGVSRHDNATSPARQYHPGFSTEETAPKNVSLKCICRLIKELITYSCVVWLFYWNVQRDKYSS